MTPRTSFRLLTLALCLAAPPIAVADGPHDAAIKARQGMFQQFGFNLGVLSDMAKEERPYDAELAARSAENLALATSLHQDAYWPEGSDADSVEGIETRALPGIWEDPADVQEKFGDLRASVESLVAVAGDGVGELRGAVGDVGGNCKACHDDYRAERN